MNKTALQQLIDKWELESKHTHLVSFSTVIEEAKSFLEIEKQQIIEANNSGGGRGDSISGQHYYDKNF